MNKFSEKIISLRSRLVKIEVPEYTSFSILAILTGAIVGISVVFFHEAIDRLSELFFGEGMKLLTFIGAGAVIIIPWVGMLLQALMRKVAPETAEKKGVTEVIKAVAFRGGYIPFRTTLFHFLAPVICIGSGGTVGPEGPAAQLGGGLASKLGGILGIKDSRRRMFTAAGSGAAIAAVFNTPLGGIFFALEIILLNDFHSPTFSALILASVTSSAISRIFLGNAPTFSFQTTPFDNYEQLYVFLILGILTGLISLAFIRYSDALGKLMRKNILSRFPRWMVMSVVGLSLGAIGYVYPDIFGIGYHFINQILSGNITWQIVAILLTLKFIFVPLILHSGGFGGIFAPTLFMGAAFGYLFSIVANSLLGVDISPTTMILVSMGALLGGVNSIPISSILIIFEMTKDYTFILPLMLAVVVSTMIVQFVLKGSVHIKHLEQQGYNISEGRETHILRSIHVKDVMIKDIVIIPEATPLPKLLAELLESPHRTFYLADESGNLSGTISESELRPIITDYDQLQVMLVAGDIARHKVVTVNFSDSLDHVMKYFASEYVDEFPVVSDVDSKKILGTIRRQDVMAAYNRESLKYNLADGLAGELKSVSGKKKALVTEGFSFAEITVPNKFVGKTIAQLRLRNKYGLEVLMVKRKASLFDEESDSEITIPDPEYIIQDGDKLVVFGSEEALNNSNKWLNNG